MMTDERPATCEEIAQVELYDQIVRLKMNNPTDDSEHLITGAQLLLYISICEEATRLRAEIASHRCGESDNHNFRRRSSVDALGRSA